MSVYIGEDNNGRNILHIAGGTHSEASMKSGSVAGTVFHSEALFISTKMFQCGSGTEHGSEIRFSIPAACIDLMFSHSPAYTFTVLLDSKVYDVNHFLLQSGAGYNASRFLWADDDNTYAVPKSNSKKIVFSEDDVTTDSNIKILVHNITVAGAIIQQYPYKNNEITIDNDNMLVNGINILKLPFLSYTKLNNTDPTILTCNGKTLQVINNSSYSESGLVLNTDDGYVKSGSRKILDFSASNVGSLGSLSSNRKYTVSSYSVDTSNGDWSCSIAVSVPNCRICTIIPVLTAKVGSTNLIHPSEVFIYRDFTSSISSSIATTLVFEDLLTILMKVTVKISNGKITLLVEGKDTDDAHTLDINYSLLVVYSL